MTAPTVGGLLLRADGKLRFLPATTALCVTSPPRVTRVPGAPAELLGVALHEGAVLPVLTVGPSRTHLIVCQLGGELLGLLGAEVVRTGAFELSSGAGEGALVVDHEGERVPHLDVAALYARVRSGGRSPRLG